MECHRAPLPAAREAHDREWAERLRLLLDTNAALAIQFRALQRLASRCSAAASDPASEGAAQATLQWCAYALAGIGELDERLGRELGALRSRRGQPGRLP